MIVWDRSSRLSPVVTVVPAQSTSAVLSSTAGLSESPSSECWDSELLILTAGMCRLAVPNRALPKLDASLSFTGRRCRAESLGSPEDDRPPDPIVATSSATFCEEVLSLSSALKLSSRCGAEGRDGLRVTGDRMDDATGLESPDDPDRCDSELTLRASGTGECGRLFGRNCPPSKDPGEPVLLSNWEDDWLRSILLAREALRLVGYGPAGDD